ncbi:hypothetical protein [Lacipirellula parvula]|uniref:Uncharacterized protein n=1 Tax=Lacipirellula parvula TaxID=2650471 RepID=A0A5K7XKZ6_9BACT|nr:hypothetical protein [Lacipirellula parvula]BBO35226.1 hypothetical protein PLANPX_4838 [Lacipirellula parvula]
MNYTPMHAHEMRAYRVAGHAVMARELGVLCETLGDGDRHYRFETFFDHCQQAAKNLPYAPVRNYVRFLMAGPAAELLRLERHHSIDHRAPGRTRFRQHWLLRRQAKPDPALDWAFAIVMGWFGGGRTRNAAEVFDDHWRSAIEAYQYPTLWKDVDRIAEEILSHDDIF